MALMDYPKLASAYDFSLAQLLGTLFFLWVLQIPMPVLCVEPPSPTPNSPPNLNAPLGSANR